MTPDVRVPDNDAATVSAADIARLAEVGRAAVSNWRRRFGDFPDPVAGTHTNPLFSLAEVEGWFAEHGKAFRVSPRDRLWQRAQATVDDMRLGDFVGLLGTVLVGLNRKPDRSRLPVGSDEPEVSELPTALRAVIPELTDELLPPIEHAWAGLVRATAENATESDRAATFVHLCERYFELHSRRLPVTCPAVADLMAALAGVSDGHTVADPACGTGAELLAAAARSAGTLVGQDTSATLARIALSRLLLAGGVARVDVGDSLGDNTIATRSADAVLCSPPFNDRSWGHEELADDPRWEYGLPPRGEPELAWVQHCLAIAKPGAHVVLTMPEAAAGRRSGRRIRSNLLRAGVLRAVITLPGQGSTPGPGLWILRRPDGDRPVAGHVLVMSEPPDLDTIARCWRLFDAGGHAELPEQARAVPVIDVLDDEVDLSPARHVTPVTHADVAEQFPETRQALASALDDLGDDLPALTGVGTPRRLATRPIGELVTAGAIEIHQAPMKTVTDSGEQSVLTVQDVRLGRPASGRTVPMPGTVWVQPGDVVLSLISGDAGPLVVDAGDVVLGPQLVLLRTDPERVDPNFLAGFLGLARRRAGHRAVSKSSRFDIRSVELPLLPLAEQQHYGHSFDQVTRFQQKLQQVTALTDALVDLSLAGLGEGYLFPPGLSEQQG